VSGEHAEARQAILEARRSIPRRAAEETALMLVPNAGYPAALEALRMLDQAWPGRARPTREGTRADWRRRGARRCGEVYGRVMPRLLASVRRLHPDMATWIVEDGYGRMLGRPGLTSRTRELIAVALLSVLGWERQLVSHLLGGRRLGATQADLLAAVAMGMEHASPRARDAASAAVRAALGGRRESPARTPRRATRSRSRARSGRDGASVDPPRGGA
jgi:4-carboxymuconolactone decarboxylase